MPKETPVNLFLFCPFARDGVEKHNLACYIVHEIPGGNFPAMKGLNMPNFALSDEVFFRAADAFPTPFHLYDENGIRKTIRDVKAAFSWAPSYREYFAVKALPNPQILKIFAEEGCGLDCSSQCELLLAQRCGVRGDAIMFSANAMPPSEYDLARSLGAVINLDDLSDAPLLEKHGGIPELISVRFNPGGEFSGGTAIMGNPGESKYGMTRDQLREALLYCRARGTKRFGLHAFLSSNSTVESYYPSLASLLFQTGKALEKETGLVFDFVNLSGGVGIPYRPEEKANDILAIGEGVRKAYLEAFGTIREDGVKLCSEMGRFMTGPQGWLLTRVVHEKQIYRDYLGVDACASCLMRPAMYGAYHHIHIAGKRNAPCDHLYDVTGCLCENNDKFAVNRMLPKTEIGDLAVIHDTGAHGLAMGYQYNGRLRCAEVLYTANDGFRLIRRAETPEDYFATLV